ncbi:hypothetical protein MCHIJ_26400 [Mycolicibacterium chitae]|uniref:Uncharacterized protein n=1 Tax=Mycolicibacterium chitae TaxID=1792 RepID=A0A448I2B5_MYCCI|nr:hypothetical protein [Mycolicibacterium chitae]MCV7105736.1 hypothetical protein [Mycolicibacterium chitae]BBZ03203.1 hypothetical protein MCHIJ_26400 [Mycolicibacterium chitae]VEG46514.1 Uncharacterised protein [Mycolicibacterium chitae]
MTQQQLSIESLGDHDYLVWVELDEDLDAAAVTLRVRADPAVVTQISGAEADERRVVAATIDYLTARQRADDLPGDVDLQDVAAFYDGYVDELQEQLRR